MVSNGIQQDQHCQQWNNKEMKDSSTRPCEELKTFTYTGDLRTSFPSGSSKEQVNDRTYLSCRLSKEKEEFNSLGNNADSCLPTAIVDNISTKKMFMEKKGALRSLSDTEVQSHAMMEVENEMLTLRQALRSQHQAIQDLYAELEEERNASSTAAIEALSMIVRLQQEKAAVHLEANQYKRLAEEKIAHDEESLALFEDVLYKKNEEIAALDHEVQAYRHRLLSIGYDDLEIRKIRWPKQSSLNDSHSDRDADSDQWRSYTELLEQEGFDGYNSLGCKNSNNTHSRDLWKTQDKKGKRYICKSDGRCFDDKWEELWSKGVTKGQDGTSGNSGRIQLEQYPVSRKLVQESIKGYSNNKDDGDTSQKMEVDHKVQGFEDSDVEPDFTAHRLKVQGAIHQMAMNMPECSLQGHSLTLWEHIENLEDRLQQLSKQRGHNCHLDEEWVSINRKLQKLVAAYTTRLREGARSRWRLSLDNTGIFDGLKGEDDVHSAVTAVDRQASNACDKKNEKTALVTNDSQIPFSENNATNLKVADDESDARLNVHDVYVIQQDCDRADGLNSSELHHSGYELEDGDRLGKPDPLPQKHQDDCSLMDCSLSKASDKVYNATSGVSIGLTVESSPTQEVKQLNLRLEALEEDREFMKHAIYSLKRQKEELSVLKEIAQQLCELKTPSKSSNVVKSPPPEENVPVVRFMQGGLSFKMRNHRHKNMGVVGSTNNVGLSNLLDKTPSRISSHITKVVKISNFTEVSNGVQDKASEVVLVTKHTVPREKDMNLIS